MMKLPSTSAGGTVPSGSSVAVTYPGVSGSRVGGVGRGVGAGPRAAGAAAAAGAAVCPGGVAAATSQTACAIAGAAVIRPIVIVIRRPAFTGIICIGDARVVEGRG